MLDCFAPSPTFQGGPSIQREIERYLRTGDSDPLYAAWNGSLIERANRAHTDLRGAGPRSHAFGERSEAPPHAEGRHCRADPM